MRSVDIAAGRGYVLSEDSPLLDLFDLSDPGAPQLLGTWVIDGYWNVSRWGLAVIAGESGAVYVHHRTHADGHYPWDDRWWDMLALFDVEGTPPGSPPVWTRLLTDRLDKDLPARLSMVGDDQRLVTPHIFDERWQVDERCGWTRPADCSKKISSRRSRTSPIAAAPGSPRWCRSAERSRRAAPRPVR